MERIALIKKLRALGWEESELLAKKTNIPKPALNSVNWDEIHEFIARIERKYPDLDRYRDVAGCDSHA